MAPSREETLLSETEIKSLLSRERHYRDGSQWTKLRETWHPDASRTSLKVSWFEGDIDSFVTASQAMSQGRTAARHLILPTEIHFSPCHRKAVSESSGNITIRFEWAGEMYELVSWTQFISKLEQVDNRGWRLVGLEPIYERDNIAPVVPLSQEKSAGAGVTFRKGSRSSYGCLAWLLEQRGFNCDMSLAGMDQQETVHALMERHFDWLNK